jgi:ABC-type bacteriocin/lantibiotic exporter with double-glycine peptidase domain
MNTPILYAAVLGVVWTTLTSDRVSAAQDVECGLRCLYVASVALGNTEDYEQLRQAAPKPASSQGYSLLQLRDMADSMGFQTLLVSTNADQLQARSQRQRFACIAWLSEQHFALVADYRDRRVLVVDPPKKYWSDTIVFSHKWPGQALLIATEPLLGEDELYPLPWKMFLIFSLGITIVAAGGTLALRKRGPA